LGTSNARSAPISRDKPVDFSAKACAQCHKPQDPAAFDFEKEFEKIAHPLPKRKRSADADKTDAN